LEKGAEVDALDKDGTTSLHWAARNGHAEIINTLLENGANAFLKDKNDKTPRDLSSNYSIKRLLDRSGENEHTALVIMGCATIFLTTTLTLTMWSSKFTFIARIIASTIIVAVTAAIALVVGIKCNKPQPSTQVNEIHALGVHYNPRDSEISMI